MFHVCPCDTVSSVPCSLVITCWERAGLLTLSIFLCFSYFPIWCPASGVVLDCIDTWSLPSFLFWFRLKFMIPGVFSYVNVAIMHFCLFLLRNRALAILCVLKRTGV